MKPHTVSDLTTRTHTPSGLLCLHVILYQPSCVCVCVCIICCCCCFLSKWRKNRSSLEGTLKKQLIVTPPPPISSPFLIIRYCAITWWVRQCWMVFGVTLINIIAFFSLSFFLSLSLFLGLFFKSDHEPSYIPDRNGREGNFILPLF